MLRKKEFNIFY